MDDEQIPNVRATTKENCIRMTEFEVLTKDIISSYTLAIELRDCLLAALKISRKETLDIPRKIV